MFPTMIPSDLGVDALEVPAAEIEDLPTVRRALADGHAAFLSPTLAPSLRFFRLGQPGLTGIFDRRSNTLWVDADQSTAEALRTVGHELLHSRNGIDCAEADAQTEAAAEAYGDALAEHGALSIHG